MTPPKRHGLLTAFLIFKFVAFSVGSLIYLFASDRVMAANPTTPPWVLAIYLFLSLVGAASVVALFRWMKWGFYFLCALAVIGMALNLYTYDSPIFASLGLLGPLILYGLLKLGGEGGAWSHLQ